MKISTINLKNPVFDISFKRKNCSEQEFLPDVQNLIFAVLEDSGEYYPVSGGRILLHEEPEQDIKTAVLPHDTPRRNLFEIFLLFEISTAVLNVVEKAQALDMACGIYPDDPAPVFKIMKMLGVPPTGHVLDQYKSIGALDEEWLETVAAGRITVKAVSEVASWSTPEKEVLLDVFAQCSFTSRMQDMFVESLRDLKKKNGYDAAVICNEAGVKHIFQEEGISEKEKAKKVMERIDGMLYPTLTKDRSEFAALKKKFGFSKGIDVIPSEYFEKDELKFTFTATTQEEYRKKVTALLEKAGKEGFRDLFGF